MTDKQPEYIITESQLKRLEKSIMYGGNNYLNSDYCILPVTECRTRPYHPAPEQCPHWVSSANLKSDFRDQDIGRFYSGATEKNVAICIQ